ncbi:Retrovirus-related Pol polyprotein from transposon TNT 1-94 [Vitis vinifera]|uniref:Retrovirus-related Pol polyprotein from transposon TNT 1-94 n=1 Tax=Vitis vinifera TaxID=29760 RepID=A0A438F5T3_VITVI|nr:Retrovirus-related Pol polyprotein from transposon TNT 1-94 [Vitis vinifera]
MSTTPGFWTMEASNMLAGPSTDAGIGEILDRRIRQRTTPNGENLVSAAPISPEQRRQHSGGLNTEQGGQQNNCSLQLHGSGRGAQLMIQVRNDMGLQGSGGTIQCQDSFLSILKLFGRIRVREHWWLFGVIYQSEDEDCEDDEIRLDINDMPDERIGNVSTGLSEEMAKMEQWKYSCSTTGPPVVEKDQLKELKKWMQKLSYLFNKEFQGDKRTRSVKLQALRRELENMKMKENETLNEFSSKFMELVNQMKSYGEEISDKRIVEKLLISLPNKFDPIVAMIEEIKDLSLLSVQELFGSLKTYEQRLLRHSEKSVESAFQSKISLNSINVERKPISNENRSDSSRGGKTGRGRARGRDGRGRGRFSYGRKFTNEEGSSFSKFKKINKQAVLRRKRLMKTCFMLVKVLLSKRIMCVLDSGCTNHMTGNKNIFLDMDTTINSQVKMGNGDLVNVKGKGTIGIQTKVGTKYIRDVLLVPALEQNLLSVGQLVEHGRFGHLNFNSLKMLCQGRWYKDCQTPLKKRMKAKKVLELIHTDICGLMSTPSQGNNKYFVLFIDDFTRMTWVFFMKQKSEVFSIFKKFKSFVEKQSGCYIKTLRSDRGMEYTSSQFGNFCEDEGVERQLTVAYTPQQNGVVERKNQTVMEMAKAILYEKGLPKIFWAEAVNTTVYLLNRCPTKALLNKTPIEAWSGRKPSVRHFKVFGCLCYSQVPKERRSKLDETSEKCIFMGYSSQSRVIGCII